MFPPFFIAGTGETFNTVSALFSLFRSFPQSLLHTPHRVPVALVFYIAVSVVFEVIENTAPCLIAAEIVGTPEKALLTIVLVLFLGVGTGGHGVETGVLTQDRIIGIPHLRG